MLRYLVNFPQSRQKYASNLATVTFIRIRLNKVWSIHIKYLHQKALHMCIYVTLHCESLVPAVVTSLLTTKIPYVFLI